MFNPATAQLQTARLREQKPSTFWLTLRNRVGRVSQARPSACQYLSSDAPTHGISYSHSMVAGGLLDTSYATRDTPDISLMMRLDTVSNNS